jgi:hypothetical protein
MDTSGTMQWGSGAIARDTNLYRAGVDTLKTDDAFQVGGALTVAGASSVADLTLSGNLNLGSARYRTLLSGVTTVANTVTQSPIAFLVIPANDAAVGAVYRIHAWGTLGVTGTPTITFVSKLGGVVLASFPAVTVRSGATDGFWDADLYLSCISTGVAGTWCPSFSYRHNFLTSVTTYTPLGPITAAPITRDTTISSDMTIFVTWSAASASNTITCRGLTAERVA